MTLLSSSITELGISLDPPVTLPADTLAARFATAAAYFGDRTAVTCGDESMTYEELNLAAARVADSLLALDLPQDAIVAIYLDRSIEMIIAMLGVIKAGAAYLPLDINYPAARIRETLDDAQPAAIVTDRSRLTTFTAHRNVFNIDDLILTSAYPTHFVHSEPSDLAYVIYTSGSTGKPKGVMVTQENVVRLLDRTAHWHGFKETDVWTMFHSFAFDFSVWEIWGALLYGGRLVIVPYTLSRSPEDFYNLLADEGVTVLNQTPTAFGLLMQAEARIKQPRNLALRYVIFGGEALNLRSLAPWFERHGDAMPQLINMYGITETTVHVTYRRIFAADAARENESLIGEPIPDLRIELLDADLKPVAPGEVGEMCIGGPGVARGYLNRPELTAERFIADPLSSTGGKLYRSGDLARQRDDGELVYLGRADRQVKINGFRIELGEIEAVLTAFSGVAQVCVVTHGETNNQRLAAYYVPTSVGVDEPALRRHAEDKLPAHMRPAFYTRMAALPINNNGKVNREALPAPTATAVTIHKPVDFSGASDLEQKIASIWRKVLKNDNIGLDDNFFDAGGSSLLLIALRGEMQTVLNTSIPVTWFFEHTTIRSFAATLGNTTQSTPAATTVVNNKAQQQRDSFARMRALRGAAR